MDVYTTGIIESNLNECDDIEELKQKILPLLQGQRSVWAKKVEQIISDNQYTGKQLAQLCKVSEPAVRKWRKGSLPQSRDMYIRIGFAAGYTLEEMNTFLMRYGKCPQLYIKSLEDAVCIFVLRSEHLAHTYETYLTVLDMVKQEFQDAPEILHSTYTTKHLSASFANLKSLEEMVTFVKANTPSYKQAYSKLYSYIIAFLQINLQNEYIVDGDGHKATRIMLEQGKSSNNRKNAVQAGLIFYRNNDVAYHQIIGRDQNGCPVWSYSSNHYERQQCITVSEIGQDRDHYYFTEGGTIIALDVDTGNVLWKNTDFQGYAPRSCIGKDGRIYLSGLEGPAFFAVSAEGETLNRISSFEPHCGIPSSIEVEDDYIVITFSEACLQFHIRTGDYTYESHSM